MTLNARRKSIYRQALVVAQDYLCAICGEYMDRDDRTLDHIVPGSVGGTNRLDNLRATHERCNIKRADSVSAADLALAAELQAVRARQRSATP